MNSDILTTFDDTTQQLLRTITSFNDVQFNETPAGGGWTAGQVAEHLYKSESWISDILNGDAKPTTRQPDQHVETIKAVFLDFSTKLKSPDFIIPSDGWHERNKLHDVLMHNRAVIKQLAATRDMTQTFTKSSMPVMGELTGIEFLTFAICHAMRHTQQLKNIYRKVATTV